MGFLCAVFLSVFVCFLFVVVCWFGFLIKKLKFNLKRKMHRYGKYKILSST